MHTMTAKYNGKCSCCGVAIRKGETIRYDKAKGAFHMSCQNLTTPTVKRPDGKCWTCGNVEGYFRNFGAATPVYCDKCHADYKARTEARSEATRSEFDRRDNSSFEDRACGNQAYEDACAAACGYGL